MCCALLCYCAFLYFLNQEVKCCVKREFLHFLFIYFVLFCFLASTNIPSYFLFVCVFFFIHEVKSKTATDLRFDSLLVGFNKCTILYFVFIIVFLYYFFTQVAKCSLFLSIFVCLIFVSCCYHFEPFPFPSFSCSFFIQLHFFFFIFPFSFHRFLSTSCQMLLVVIILSFSFFFFFFAFLRESLKINII